MQQLSLEKLIYVVEPNDDERELIAGIFADFFPDCTLRPFQHGAEVLTQLTHRLDGRLPDLILSELDMPVLDGFDLLRCLKQDDLFRLIPTVIFSASTIRADIDQSYALGSNAYVQKPGDYVQTLACLGRLQHYWSELVRTPALLKATRPRRHTVYEPSWARAT